MKTVEYYCSFFKKIMSENKKFHGGYMPYGEGFNIILDEYKKINEFEERDAFVNAIEKMLMSKNKGERRFAINSCLAFFVFSKNL